MERIGLRRFDRSDQGTKGVLLAPEGPLCNALELPWRDNAPGLSCIPCGEYVAKLRKSPRFGWTYHITDVKGRTWILTHSGNLAGDVTKGYLTDTEGCILVGRYFGTIQGQLAVLASRPALRSLMERMGGKDFILVVEDDYNASSARDI
jgi:hypothetical protein